MREHTHVADRRDQRCRRDRADAGNRQQALALGMAVGYGFEFVIVVDLLYVSAQLPWW
jgi:hypothetical protein